MPTYYTIDSVKIQLFFNDHVPPHLHAVIAEFEALIGLNPVTILQGALPKNKQKKILRWVEEN